MSLQQVSQVSYRERECICPDSDSERTAPQAVRPSWTKVQSEDDRQREMSEMRRDGRRVHSVSVYTLIKMRLVAMTFPARCVYATGKSEISQK